MYGTFTFSLVCISVSVLLGILKATLDSEYDGRPPYFIMGFNRNASSVSWLITTLAIGLKQILFITLQMHPSIPFFVY